MERMVGLFTLVVEGHVDYDPTQMGSDDVMREIKVELKKQVGKVIHSHIAERSDGRIVWSFEPMRGDFSGWCIS